MLQGCKDRAVMLQDYVETVMEGLQTVANILAVKKVFMFLWISIISFFIDIRKTPNFLVILVIFRCEEKSCVEKMT